MVTLELVGGSSSRSFDVIVTPSEQSPVSAKGMINYIQYQPLGQIQGLARAG